MLGAGAGSAWTAVSAFGDNRRRGDPAVVAHGQVPALDALGLRHGQHGAFDLDGRTVLVQPDPAVLPVHAGRRPQHLGHGLLGRKPRGERACVQFPLGGDEQPVAQAGGALELTPEPLDVYDVYAYANDHGVILRSRSWPGCAAGPRRNPWPRRVRGRRSAAEPLRAAAPGASGSPGCRTRVRRTP